MCLLWCPYILVLPSFVQFSSLEATRKKYKNVLSKPFIKKRWRYIVKVIRIDVMFVDKCFLFINNIVEWLI